MNKTYIMKKLTILLFTALITLTSTKVFSQGAGLPQASPAASVMQTFGSTKVEIDYHCPGVKGRTVWGGIVPYDSIWRTGANEATTISFSTDVMVGGQKVKSGKYALFTIPGRDTWTIILNSDADQWGAYGYNKSKDVVRFIVKAGTADFKEKLSFHIDAMNDSMAHVTLLWEKVKVGFDVDAKTVAMMQKSIDNNWRTLANAANYYVDNKLDLNKAHQWAAASIALESNNFFNQYVMARVLQAKGENKEALKYVEESKKIGDGLKDDNFYDEYKTQVAKLVTDLSSAKK
jgi:hypothetical protein